MDLVLLDHYMPDRNGLAMVRELRRRGHHTDVIMVTAARDVATVQEAMRHGALQYLVKPFAYAGLRTKLEAYAALRHTLERGGEAEQGEVDRLFGALWAAGEPDLPKGHSPTTAELVRQALRSAEGPLSAQEIAESAGDEQADRPALSEAAGADRQGPADAAVRRDGPPGTPLHLVHRNTDLTPPGPPARPGGVRRLMDVQSPLITVEWSCHRSDGRPIRRTGPTPRPHRSVRGPRSPRAWPRPADRWR